jgi:hypothetical protein
VSGSLPADVTLGIALAPLVAFRLSEPARADSITSTNVTLTNDGGPVAVRIVTAEGGRLVFVRAAQPLMPDEDYVLSVEGLQSLTNAELVPWRNFSLARGSLSRLPTTRRASRRLG